MGTAQAKRSARVREKPEGRSAMGRREVAWACVVVVAATAPPRGLEREGSG